jgi:hypothetical protein
MRTLVLSNVSTEIYHHTIDESPSIVVVEQHFLITGIIEYTMKMKHFDTWHTENPIRLYTNVPNNQ